MIPLQAHGYHPPQVSLKCKFMVHICIYARVPTTKPSHTHICTRANHKTIKYLALCHLHVRNRNRNSLPSSPVKSPAFHWPQQAEPTLC